MSLRGSLGLTIIACLVVDDEIEMTLGLWKEDMRKRANCRSIIKVVFCSCHQWCKETDHGKDYTISVFAIVPVLQERKSFCATDNNRRLGSHFRSTSRDVQWLWSWPRLLTSLPMTPFFAVFETFDRLPVCLGLNTTPVTHPENLTLIFLSDLLQCERKASSDELSWSTRTISVF